MCIWLIFPIAFRAPWSTGGTLWGSAQMHDRQIIGIAEVNVQFGHGLAQKGGREKKKSAAGHPYKCDVSCTNRFQCVMWPWVTTNCISSFHHNIQAAKRDTRSPSVCRPCGSHRQASTHVIVMTSYGHTRLIFCSGRMLTCGLLESRMWCKLRPGWRRLKQPGEMTGESNIYS